MLDPAAFQQWFTVFMQQFAAGGEDAGVLAVDGKTLRRSYDRAEQRSPLHPVGVWAEEQRLVLGQLAVDTKSNEITALPQLLEMLTLRGIVKIICCWFFAAISHRATPANTPTSPRFWYSPWYAAPNGSTSHDTTNETPRSSQFTAPPLPTI